MGAATRRDFLRFTGLAAGAGVLTLRAGAQPTAASGSPAISEQVRRQFGDPSATLRMKDGAAATARNALGPFYARGAPFRGKVSPPRAAGIVLVVAGRVWGFDTRAPLPGAIIDLWHCDIHGNYANDAGDYRYRARIITSETGAYEYETIRPVVYDNHGDLRSPHIHYRVTSPGYRTLVTQLFFEGDPKHTDDHLFDPTLMVGVERRGGPGEEYEAATFDVVLQAGESDPAEDDGPRRRRRPPR
ncbi:MAG: twin-arginine translocation signal domain-containing protein [Phycisphaerales bacterium]